MVREIYHAGSLSSFQNSYSQYSIDLKEHHELDNLRMSYVDDGDGSLDSLAHLLGDPFDYMYDIVWESNF